MSNCWIFDWVNRELAVLRPCLCCETEFLSPSSGFRRCKDCTRREEESRARPFQKTTTPDGELAAIVEDFFDVTSFDPEAVARRKAYEKQREIDRAKRSGRYRRHRF